MTSQSSDEYTYELKVPKERIAILIGKQGEVKNLIEESTKTKLNIDSKEGDITISGKDALQLYCCREIIRAIARGFNPDIALKLLKQDMSLEIISIEGYSGGPKDIERLRGRVIGEGGKSRKLIEEITESAVSVYGKTVAIISDYEGVAIARRAVESLLTGSQHANVYKWLEKQRAELNKKRMLM